MVINESQKYMLAKLEYSNSESPFHKDVEGDLAYKIVMRNLYFINYFFAAYLDIGQCGQLTSLVFFNYVTEMTRMHKKRPTMQIVSVSNERKSSENPFKNRKSGIYDHTFFLIGKNLPQGLSKVEIDASKPIPKKYLNGWVCDLWNKDLVFGKLRDIIEDNKIYDLSKWETISVKDISDPFFEGSKKNYRTLPNRKLIQYDYFLNPDLFLENSNASKLVTETLKPNRIDEILNLPKQIAYSVKDDDKKDETTHSEL